MHGLTINRIKMITAKDVTDNHIVLKKSIIIMIKKRLFYKKN